MALVKGFSRVSRERHSVHDSVECTVTVFNSNGRTFLQLDTYGSASRQLKGKVSQSIQLDEAAAKSLHALIAKAFKV